MKFTLLYSMEDILYCEPGRIFCRAKKILLAVDGSKGSARATSVAFEIAELTKSVVYIVHVVPTPTVKQFAIMADADPDVIIAKYDEKGKKLLDGYASSASDYKVEVETMLEHGLPSDRILSVSRDKEVDIIVVGHEGATGGKRAGMGSATERIVLGADCTVLVAK